MCELSTPPESSKPAAETVPPSQHPPSRPEHSTSILLAAPLSTLNQLEKRVRRQDLNAPKMDSAPKGQSPTDDVVCMAAYGEFEKLVVLWIPAG